MIIRLQYRCISRAIVRDTRDLLSSPSGVLMPGTLVDGAERWPNSKGQVRVRLIPKGTASSPDFVPAGWTSETAGDGKFSHASLVSMLHGRGGTCQTSVPFAS